MRKDFVLHARYMYVPSSSMSTVLILATVFCGPAYQLQQSIRRSRYVSQKGFEFSIMPRLQSVVPVSYTFLIKY